MGAEEGACVHPPRSWGQLPFVACSLWHAGDGEGLFRGGEQGHQGLLKIQRHPQVSVLLGCRWRKHWMPPCVSQALGCLQLWLLHRLGLLALCERVRALSSLPLHSLPCRYMVYN